jgi:SAM-dependent methyltransferase
MDNASRIPLAFNKLMEETRYRIAHYLLERPTYRIFGNTCMKMPEDELSALRQIVQQSSYLRRDVIDLGCGDGQVSKRLKDILEAHSIKGLDYSPRLVEEANKRIYAEVHDLMKEPVSGDLAVFWGSLHHLPDPVYVLNWTYQNFNKIIIREDKNTHRAIELGHKWSRMDLDQKIMQARIPKKNYAVFEPVKDKLFICISKNPKDLESLAGYQPIMR